MAVHIIDHPLIKEKLSVLRHKETPKEIFKENLDEIVTLMTYEVTRDLTLTTYPLETPLAPTLGYQLARPVVLVPILRAGLGFLNGMQRLLPQASVGHIAMARDEKTLQPKTYYAKFPSSLSEADVIVLDPMLATGGSACDAISVLKEQGAKRIRMVALVAAPEGLEALQKTHPEVTLYLAALDESLNEQGYILPGLGDAGDRLFGTED